MSVERIDVTRIAPQPWRNGAGLTRELARGGAGDDAAFDWRISLAEVERDAPFSAFPGVDRCIALLHGAGMHLRSDDGSIDHRLTDPWVPFAFSGDVPLAATLVDGACRDLNVMTRRGAMTSRVSCHRSATELGGSDVTLLLCCAGTWAVDGPHPVTLAPGHALLWREPPGVRVARPRPGAGAAALLRVQLCHDRTA